MQHRAFYNVTLKNFVTPWTNRDQTVFAPLNDYTATVIGMVRDDVDFRQCCPATSSTSARRPRSAGLFAGQQRSLSADGGRRTSTCNDRAGADDAVARTPASPAAATAGVMTTRAAAQAFFVAGTNRAMFRFTLMNHMCKDLEQVQDMTLPPDRIRQDVSRCPGGDSRAVPQQLHRLPHRHGSAGAGLRLLQLRRDRRAACEYTDGVVQPKYLINKDNFTPGYVDPGRRLGQLLAQGRATRCSAGTARCRAAAAAPSRWARSWRTATRSRAARWRRSSRTVCLPPPSDARTAPRSVASLRCVPGERLPAEGRLRRDRRLLHGRLRSSHGTHESSCRPSCAGRRPARAALAACSGGATTTEQSRSPRRRTVADYTGPAPTTADVQAFRINLWENIKANNRCGGCHNAAGQAPQFVRNDDVNLAYADGQPRS